MSKKSNIRQKVNDEKNIQEVKKQSQVFSILSYQVNDQNINN